MDNKNNIGNTSRSVLGVGEEDELDWRGNPIPKNTEPADKPEEKTEETPAKGANVQVSLGSKGKKKSPKKN